MGNDASVEGQGIGMIHKKAIVIHSGGMDSSLCLALACQELGKDNVLSLSFSYEQRHSTELQQAQKICNTWGVDHVSLSIECLQEIPENALMNSTDEIQHEDGEPPNTLVVGRNGLMARLGAIHANSLGANFLYMGVIEVEASNSGYRDCSRKYMDMMQEILRVDLDNDDFEIRTPIVKMTKKETMELGNELGVLEYLLAETITCYEGVRMAGCRKCPACKLRNEGIAEFVSENDGFVVPYDL